MLKNNLRLRGVNNATGTLVTTILLGALGRVPAYDVTMFNQLNKIASRGYITRNLFVKWLSFIARI